MCALSLHWFDGIERLKQRVLWGFDLLRLDDGGLMHEPDLLWFFDYFLGNISLRHGWLFQLRRCILRFYYWFPLVVFGLFVFMPSGEVIP